MDKFFNNDRDSHRKKPENLKKHSPSLIVLSQCSKTYPHIICFFSGFLIQKMAAALDHSKVSVYGLDLKQNFLAILGISKSSKKQIILGQFFFTPREDNV